MNKRLKIIFSAFLVGLFFLCFVSQVILTRDPASEDFPLKQVWKAHLRGSIVGLSYASEKTILARTSTFLNALDAKNGQVLWVHALSWQADPKPAITKNGKVYITDGDLLLALDVETGSVLWQYPTSYTESWVTGVSEKVVIVNQVGVDIMVFDADTGTFLWRKPVCRGFVPAYSDDIRVYIPCDGLESIDIKTGKTIWTDHVGTLGDTAYSSNIAYYYLDSVQAYDLKQRKKLWDTGLANSGFESFKVVQHYLFYTDAVRLCTLDTTNGHLEWCAKTPYPQTPTVIQDNVYVFDGSHKVVMGFEISNGKEIGMLRLANFNYFIISRQLLTANENLLFFANGKNLYAYAN